MCTEYEPNRIDWITLENLPNDMNEMGTNLDVNISYQNVTITENKNNK